MTHNLLQIVSDIHLEFYKKLNEVPIIIRHAPYIALVGDIGNCYTQIYYDFIYTQSITFSKVFLVLGNHCFYSKRHSVDQIIQQVRDICEKFNNVFLLERNHYHINNKITLLGATLWSNIDSYSSWHINDFKNILVLPKKTKYMRSDINFNLNICLTREIYIEYHKRDLSYIEEQLEILEKENRQVIILTHYAPSHKMQGIYENSKIKSAFATNLEYLFKPPVIAWGSGHLHSNVDTTINNIRSVSNCMGYPKEETNYKENVVIKVDLIGTNY